MFCLMQLGFIVNTSLRPLKSKIVIRTSEKESRKLPIVCEGRKKE